MDDLQRREFHEALLEAASFEDLPGKSQAAILKAEQNRPKPADYQQRLKNESEARTELGSAFVSVVATSNQALG